MSQIIDISKYFLNCYNLEKGSEKLHCQNRFNVLLGDSSDVVVGHHLEIMF